jgi:hypothetical protein
MKQGLCLLLCLSVVAHAQSYLTNLTNLSNHYSPRLLNYTNLSDRPLIFSGYDTLGNANWQSSQILGVTSLEFSSQTGRIYQVQYLDRPKEQVKLMTNNLGQVTGAEGMAWINVSPLLPGTGSNIFFRHGTIFSNGFYRVAVK